MPLGPGSIAFTGFNADGNDNIAFVALEEIPAGMVIYFNDNEWTGSGFTSGESSYSWTAGGTIAAGTIVTINGINSDTPTSNLGTVAYIDSTDKGVSNSNEMLYAYVGSVTTPTAFLAAVANDGFANDGATLSGTGLTVGATALDLGLVDSDADIGAFNGARNNQASFSAYAAILNTASNWVTQDASGDQSADGNAPDVPFGTAGFTVLSPLEGQLLGLVNLSVTRIEQDAGETTTFTFTVTRSGGTSGQLDFSGSIAGVTTDSADFGGSLPSSFSGTIAPGATSTTVTVTISGDVTVESDESFTLTLDSASNNLPNVGVVISGSAATATGLIRNDDAGSSIGGIAIYDPAASLEGDATPPTASTDFQLIRLGSIQGSPAGSEVVAFEDGVAYNMNNNGTQIDKIAVAADGALSAAGIIDFTVLSDFGGGNSVAIQDGLLAFAYNSATAGNAGHVALIDAATGTVIKTLDVGVGPDQITFSPDGTKLLTADEGERANASDNYAGSVSIIDLSGGAANAVVSNTIGFSALDGSEYALINRGVAIAAGQTASNDIEPEYIAVSPDGTTAYVTLQEVNAVAVIDLTDASAIKPIAIQPLGSIDRSLLGNAFDGNDQTGGLNNGISFVNFDVASLPQPDAIASFEVGGTTYFVTANEGDARVGLIDEVRLSSSSYVLDPTAYPNAAAIKAAIGRLNVITTAGDTDGDGDYDQITTYGGRGISIFRQNADGTIEKVRETGGEFEAIIARDFPTLHNTENLASPDNRSDNKGPEPEGVSIGVVSGRIYAFVNLERVGGVMVYDVTDPANAEFVTFKPAVAGDFAPEVNKFVAAEDSPTGAPILLTANEASNSVTLYSVVSQTEGDDKILGGAANDVFAGKGGNDWINGNGGTDTSVYAGEWAGYEVTAGGVEDIDASNGDEGADTLENVETLRFAGVDVAAADAVNDAPIGANDDNAGDAVIEDGIVAGDATAMGNVLANDSDADLTLGLGETLAVTGGRAGSEGAGGALTAVAGATLISGTYGDLTVNADGSYSYALDNSRAATQALNEGQTAHDIFTYEVTDAHGLIDLAELDISITGAKDPILGTAGNDVLNGTADADVIKGLAGNDKLFGNGGDDVLNGGLGKDTLNGGEGSDTADYSDAASAVKLSLGSGGSLGEAMGDRFVSIENFHGSAFDDIANGTAAANQLDGGDGADILNGLGGNDLLFGEGGDDRLVGGYGADELDGGDGFDLLIGGVGFDILSGGDGDDVFEGRLIDIKGDHITDFAEGDTIRVLNLNPALVTVSWAAGVLAIDPDGAGIKAATTLLLDGSFNSANFHVAGDGLGNTLIIYETVI